MKYAVVLFLVNTTIFHQYFTGRPYSISTFLFGLFQGYNYLDREKVLKTF